MPGSDRIRKKVRQRFEEQNGRCYWCGVKCFLPSRATLRMRARKAGIEIGSPNWRKVARGLTATAEHLTPKTHGGSDAWSNIVMACKACNNARGDDMTWTPFAEAAE